MLSLQATYDGKQIHFASYDKLPEVNQPKPVIVTFLEAAKSDITANELHFMAQRGGALDFLASEKEDIYSDMDLKQ